MSSENEQETSALKTSVAEIADIRPSQLLSPVGEVERLVDRPLPRAWLRPVSLDWPVWGAIEESLKNIRVPRLNVIDRDKEILIDVELPGAERKDVEESINERVLVIKASVSRDAQTEEKGYFRREITRNDFSRSLALPDGIDAEKVSATLTDGVLEIVLPKEEGQQRRSVVVQ